MQTNKFFVLSGDPCIIPIPNNFISLNEKSEDDRQGIYIFPDRINSEIEKTNVSPLNRNSFFEIFKEISLFDNSQPGIEEFSLGLNILQKRNNYLNFILNYLKKNYGTLAQIFEKKQKLQLDGYFALKKNIINILSSQDEMMKEHEAELKKIKDELIIFPSDIVMESLTIRKDESDDFDNSNILKKNSNFSYISKYINKEEINNSFEYIQLYLNPSNSDNQIDNAVSLLRKKLHQTRSTITNIDETQEFLNINYQNEYNKILEILGKIEKICQDFQIKLSEIEKSSNLFINPEIWNRDYLKEIIKLYEELINYVNKSNQKKYNFNANLQKYLIILINEKLKLTNDSQSEILSKFQQAQKSLNKLKFYRNLNHVYNNCKIEMNRREVVSEEHARFITLFNEEIDKKYKEENRKRRDFLSSQKKLLGGIEIPFDLYLGINDTLEIPQVNIYENNLDQSLIPDNFINNNNVDSDYQELIKLNYEKDKKIEDLENKLKNETDLVEALKKQIEFNIIKFNESNKINIELKKANEMIKDEFKCLEPLKLKFEDINPKYIQLQNENNNLKQNLKQNIESINKLNYEILLLNNRVNNQVNSINELSQELTKKTNEIDQLQKVNSFLEKDIEELNNQLKNDLSKLYSNNLELMNIKTIEINNLNENIKNKDSIIDNQKEEIVNLKNKLNETISKISEKMELLFKQNEKLKSEIEDQKLNDQKSKNEILKLGYELQIKKQQLEITVKNFETVSKNNEILSQKLIIAENEVNSSLKNYIDELQNSLTRSIENIWSSINNNKNNLYNLKKAHINNNEALINLRDQLTETISTFENISSVVITASNFFPILHQIDEIFKNSIDDLKSIKNSLSNISEIINLNENKLKQSIQQSIDYYSEPKPNTPLLFNKVDDLFYTEYHNGVIYYLDPESTRNQIIPSNIQVIIGMVNEIIDRTPFDDPLKLKSSYKTVKATLISFE